MTQRLKIGNLTVEAFFNQYDKNSKKQIQIPGHPLTVQDRVAINNGLDDTDFGEFYQFENEDIKITGCFQVVESNFKENE
jgi:hypothetical protein